jgi:type II secretory pathway pseudopilin PulG
MSDLTLVSTIAAAVAAIAAAISALLSYRGNVFAQKVAREQVAAQAIAQYIDLNLRYPEFSTTKKWERYSNYVFGVLTMARTVLAAYPTDKNWHDLIKEHLGYHRDELTQWKDDLHVFGPEVVQVVDEVLRTKTANSVAVE